MRRVRHPHRRLASVEPTPRHHWLGRALLYAHWPDRVIFESHLAVRVPVAVATGYWTASAPLPTGIAPARRKWLAVCVAPAGATDTAVFPLLFSWLAGPGVAGFFRGNPKPGIRISQAAAGQERPSTGHVLCLST